MDWSKSFQTRFLKYKILLPAAVCGLCWILYFYNSRFFVYFF